MVRGQIVGRDMAFAGLLAPAGEQHVDAVRLAGDARVDPLQLVTREQTEALLEVALRHPIRTVVSALGSPPKETVERLHGLGIKVGALAGKTEHALRHKAARVDFVVAQGMEAGGHTGKVTLIILWPHMIDAVAPLPVLAAGGVGRGRQMAAALALGAEGVWCGSIWLGTRESELNPALRRRLFAAGSEHTVQSRLRPGKPARVLRSKLSDAWERPDAPPFAPMPYQTMLMVEPQLRVERGEDEQWQYYRSVRSSATCTPKPVAARSSTT
ncbi:MAG: nitronate monooxygenase [Burkholderiaceae bacterium]|nr:nitronate monooxygenase [Burkholderiaceae bacterium]